MKCPGCADEFTPRVGGRGLPQKYCTKYCGGLHRQRLFSVGQRARRKALIAELKHKPCVDCLIDYPPFVMDFDHRPGTEKFKEIAHMLNYTEARIRAEAAKCDVVCANCHRFRTEARRAANR